MAGYIQSITLGGGGIDLKTQKAATEFFIGANFSSTAKIQTTAKAAGGIDTGNKKGQYRLLYDVAIRCVEKLAISKATDVTFTVYESDDNDSFVAGAVYTTKIDKLNEARRTPLSFPVYSTAARYLVLGIKFSGNSASASDAVTAGQIIVSIQPASY